MSSIVVSGDTSGTVTLQAPAVAGSTTLTLPSTSGSVVIGTTPSGTIVGTTDTQTLTNKTLTSPTITGASISSMASSVLTSGTAVASTSGTSIDFTGIPSWAKRITVMFSGVSTSGTSVPIIQIGASTTPETTSYTGSFTISNTASASANLSTGFAIGVSGTPQAATTVKHGIVTLALLNSSTNLWTAFGVLGQSDIAQSGFLGGSKSITGTLGVVRITTVNGTDTFDAGSINIMYE